MRAVLVVAVAVVLGAGAFLRSEFLVCLATGHGCSAPELDAPGLRTDEDARTSEPGRPLRADRSLEDEDSRRVPVPSAANDSGGPVRYILPGGQIGYASDRSQVPEGATVLDALPSVQEVRETRPGTGPTALSAREELERLRRENLRAAEEEARWRQSANESADWDQARLESQRERERIREERESRRRGWSYSRTTSSPSTTGSRAWR